MPNRLAAESSPYLQQHKDNPVDWYPWGPEALARARSANTPILVSIGYSTCHWCHVMAHESFEDPAIAALMNDGFTCIKVDREERPDIDAIYMSAIQAMTGQGGWPLNVFLTPEAVPFFGGTYFPPRDKGGMPGFPRVLEAVHAAWTRNPDGVRETAGTILEYLAKASSGSPVPAGRPLDAVCAQALSGLAAQFDHEWGGFGNAPKFPQASVFDFLLRHHRRTSDPESLAMLTVTLDRMAAGGIYDHLGGGFARYAVDREWLVPHFEKMLYDNAQLMRVYLEAWRLTGTPAYRAVVEETAGWLLREMRSPGGGFWSALDADSEGVEGKFYVWTPAEIDGALPPEQADLVKLHFGVTEDGNFEGASILHVARPLTELAQSLNTPVDTLRSRIDEARALLVEERAKRIRPGTDTKVIVGWNGLAIGALATAGAALGRPDFVQAATEAAFLIARHGYHPGGALARTVANDEPTGIGLLEDHAFLASGLLELYAATGNMTWLDAAWKLAKSIVTRFREPGTPGFFDTAADHETLIVRPRDLQDGATPSGNSVAIDVLLTLSALSEQESLREPVDALLASVAAPMAEYPGAFGHYLAVAERTLADERQLVLAGSGIAPFRDAFFARFKPFVTLGYAAKDLDASAWPTLADRPLPSGASAAAYLCQGKTCLPPVTDPGSLPGLLDRDAH